MATPVQPSTVPTAQVAMTQMILGFWISRAICVLAQLGIADQLKQEARSATELAAATATHAPSLHRLLRALATVGVLTEGAEGRFGLTPLSETLRTDVPGSLCSFAVSELGGENYAAWGELIHSVKTGETAFDHVFGMGLWEFFQKNPEDARVFNDSMSGATAETNEAILRNYDFSGIKRMVDVGGGHGGLITFILHAFPEMTGVLFDAPLVIEGARLYIESANLADRCKTMAGDFFKAVPTGADAYLLKWVLHDWNDQQAQTILGNCRSGITDDGRLIVVEAVIPPGSEPHFSKFIDLNMLVMTGGLERSEEEFRRLLAASGFRLERVIPTESPISIIEALPA